MSVRSERTPRSLFAEDEIYVGICPPIRGVQFQPQMLASFRASKARGGPSRKARTFSFTIFSRVHRGY
jgi:hypothetical protein